MSGVEGVTRSMRLVGFRAGGVGSSREKSRTSVGVEESRKERTAEDVMRPRVGEVRRQG